MKFIKDDLIQESTVLFMLNMLASILNYVCQLLMAQVLSVESFGTVNTIFSFMMIVSVPGTTLTMTASKYYAQLSQDCQDSERTGFIVRVFRYVTFASAVFFVLCIGAMHPLSQVLSIVDAAVLILMSALSALSLYQPLYTGVFAGNKQFILVGLYALTIPIYKILSVIAAKILFVNDWQRLYTILAAMIVGTILTALVGHYGAKRVLGKFSVLQRSEHSIKITSKSINVLILNICLMVYMNIDLLAVRYYGGKGESGLYSSVLLFGRVIYYFATTLGTILLPLVAARQNKREQQKRMFRKMMGLLVIFMALCVGFFNVGGGFLIELLYGNSYMGAQPYVKYVSLISVALSICTVLIHYLVGVDRTRFAACTMAAINGIIFVLIVLESDIKVILTGIGMIGLGGAILIYLFSVFMKEQKQIS